MERLLEDLRNGRIDAQRLIDLIATVQRDLLAARQRITDLEQRNAELKKQLAAASGTAKLAEPFSLPAEEKRQQARGNKRRRRPDQG